MKLSQLAYMYEVSRCGNITTAAAKLYVTQPTLSQQIMNLEEELDVKLFIRMPRSIKLTPAGEEFLIYAKRILSDVDNLTTAMQDYSQLRRGKIKIGMLATFGSLNIIDKLAIFQRENPQIETYITIGNSKSLLDMLGTHELDVAFVIISGDISELGGSIELTKILEDPMMVMLPNGHRLAVRDSVDFEDLRGESIILPAKTSGLYSPILQGFAQRGIEPRIVCETSHPELCLQMVSSGMGIAFASERVVNANRGYPYHAAMLATPIPRSIYYASLKDMREIQAIRRFTDYITNEYAG